MCSDNTQEALCSHHWVLGQGFVGSENMQDVDATPHVLHRHLALSLAMRRSDMQMMAVWTSRHFEPKFVFSRGPYLDDCETGRRKREH
jgi:hypothetical protein